MSRIFTASFFAKDDWHDPSGDNVFSIANRQPRKFGLPLLHLFRPGKVYRDFRRRLREWGSEEADRISIWERYEFDYEDLLRMQRGRIAAWVAMLTGDITLCCWEEDPNECHRKWAGEWLATELGCEVTVR